MNDARRTKKQLVDELADLRAQLTEAHCHTQQLEESLRATQQSEQRFRLLFELTPIAYQSLDENGCFIEVNQAWLDMLGYPKEHVIGRSFGEFLAPCLQDGFIPCFERFKAAGEIHGVEWELVRRDGAHLIASFEGMISYDPQGNFRQTHCIVQDITARAQMEALKAHAEKALRESEARARALLDASPDAAFLMTPGGILVALNAETARRFGKSVNEMLGRDVYDFLPPDVAQHRRAHVETLLQSGQPLRFEDKRSGRVIDNSLVPILDQQAKVVQVAVFGRDVTARVQMAEALREAELRYRTVADFTYDWEYWMAPDGRLLYVSPSCERITGYRAAEFVNTPQLVSQIVLLQDRDTWDQHHRAYDRSADPRTLRFRIRRPDGEIRWIEHVCQPVVTENDTFLGFRASNRDVTERQQMEDELRQSENRYHKLFSEMVAGSALHEIICDSAGYPVDYVTLEANKTYEVMLNVKKDDIIGRRASAILTKDELQNWLGVFGPVALTGEPAHYDVYSPLNQRHFAGTVFSPAPGRFAVTFNDVTKRKQMETALRESERQKALVLDATTEVIAYYDTDLRVLWANRAAGESVGKPSAELIGLHCYEIWNHRNSPCPDCPVLRTRDSGIPSQAEEQTPDGRYWLVRGYPILGDDEQVIAFAEFSLDITAQIRAKEALELNESRLESLLELTDMTGASLEQITDFALEGAIKLTKSQLGFLGFMDREETMMHIHAWSKEAMAQCAVVDYPLHFPIVEAGLWGEAVRQRAPVVINDYAAPGLPRKGYPDGHTPLARLLTIPVFDGQRIVAVAAVANKAAPYDDADVRQLTLLMDGMWRIVRQRQMEEAQRASEEKLRTLFTILPVGISVLNHEREIVEMNPAMGTVLDISQEGLQQGWYRQRTYLHGDGAPMSPDEFASTRAMREQRAIHDVDTGVVKEDGAVVWTAVSAAPLPNGGAVLAVLDITGRKKMEEDLSQHNRRLTLLNHAGQALNASLDPAQVLNTLLVEIQHTLNVTACSVWLRDPESGELVCQHATGAQSEVVRGWRLAPGQGLVGWAMRSGQSLIVPDAQADERYFAGVDRQTGLALHSILTVPLTTRSGVIGVIQAVDTTADAFDATSLQLLEPLATIAAAAISNAGLFEAVQSSQERLQTLSQRLVEAQEAERRRVARELHDVIGQALTAIKINLQAAQRLWNMPEPEKHLRQGLQQVVSSVDDTLQQVRNLSVDLRPSLLDDLGLAPAVRWYLDRQAQQMSFTAQFVADPALERRLSPHLEIACFRIVQEALTNVARHAQARQVRVEMHEQNGELVLRIVDDGVGFDVHRALWDAGHGASLGLLGIQERAALVGGRVEFSSAPAGGAVVTVRLPLLPRRTNEV